MALLPRPGRERGTANAIIYLVDTRIYLWYDEYEGGKVIELVRTKQSNKIARYYISTHYTQTRWFVGRNLCYLIKVDNEICGVMVGGSTSYYLPGRKEFFGDVDIQDIINNRLFRIENNTPNLGTQLLKLWRYKVVEDWELTYHSIPIGFETLVKPPRTGAVYKADNWTFTAITKGYKARRFNKHHKILIPDVPRLVFSKKLK